MAASFSVQTLDSVNNSVMSDAIILPNPDSMIHKAFAESGELMDTTINWLKHRNPYPFDARIEYLESTGTQYVDTGIVPTGATGIDCDFAILNIAANFSPVFWSRGSSSTDRAFCFEGEYVREQTKAQARWDYGSYGPQQVRNVVEQGARTTASVRSDTLTVDSTTLARNEQTVTGAGAIILFNFCNYVNGERQMLSATVQPIRIYSCTIYDGSTLVRDFIPVRAGQTGYLYDKVSLQLFANKGTGDFILGPDL